MFETEKKLALFLPFNEQEERDRELIVNSLRTQRDIFTRDNTVQHMTASAWVVNQKRDKVLMAYHNLYHSWSWLGGHADGEEDLLAVALREVREESGVRNVRPVRDEIFSVEVLTVDGHIKRGRYVSSHLHLNVTYLLEANEADELQMKPDENSGVAWFGLQEALEAVSEVWMKEHIYSKLVKKLAVWEKEQ